MSHAGDGVTPGTQRDFAQQERERTAALGASLNRTADSRYVGLEVVGAISQIAAVVSVGTRQ